LWRFNSFHLLSFSYVLFLSFHKMSSDFPSSLFSQFCMVEYFVQTYNIVFSFETIL
jgi:hypothetical protein